MRRLLNRAHTRRVVEHEGARAAPFVARAKELFERVALGIVVRKHAHSPPIVHQIDRHSAVIRGFQRICDFRMADGGYMTVDLGPGHRAVDVGQQLVLDRMGGDDVAGGVHLRDIEVGEIVAHHGTRARRRRPDQEQESSHQPQDSAFHRGLQRKGKHFVISNCLGGFVTIAAPVENRATFVIRREAPPP